MQQTVIDDRYTLVKPLGGGGMARVYLAHDEVLDRDVALKVLREQYADDEEFVERFRREARNAASLSHPNIVSVYDQGRSEDGAYYMAMEYVPKGTLKDRIKRDGALAPVAAAGVALQIADALQAAHDKGVIHRDIKPQNVLVTGTGDVRVADFGIARAVSATPVTRTGHVMGTAGYMSPEQAKGDPVGPRSDLYSLGVVLYEMLTGNLPYEADSALVQAMKHVNEPPPSPREANPEVSKTLDALTMKLLAKDPQDRYPSAGALANDLERVYSGLPQAVTGSAKTQEEATTAPLPPPERTRRTAVRPPTTAPAGPPVGGERRRGRFFPILAALLFVVALVGGLAWALTQFGVPDLGGSKDRTVAENTSTTSSATVPDLYWSTEAEVDLARAELKLGNRNVAPSATVPVNVVIESNPPEGSEVEPGSVVDIVVSTGPQQAPVVTPPYVPGGVAPPSGAVAPPSPPEAPPAVEKDKVEKDKPDKPDKEKPKGKGKQGKEKNDDKQG